MNVISGTYQLRKGVEVQITMRSQRVIGSDEVRSFGLLAEAAEKMAAEHSDTQPELDINVP